MGRPGKGMIREPEDLPFNGNICFFVEREGL